MLTETIPAKLFEIKANLPIVGSENQRQQSQQLNRILKKMVEVQLIFRYFAHRSWIYESKTADAIAQVMSPEDVRDFPFDIRRVDWYKCLQLFSYGLRRYYIKEDIVGPNMHYEQLLFKN